MFKLKTVGAVTLALLLLLSGCSSNNQENEVESVNNTLPYDSRTVTTTIPEEWSQLTVAWGDGSSLSIPFPGEGATRVFGKEVSSVERVGLVADASGEVQYSIDMPYNEHNIHFHVQVLAKDVGEGGEEPAMVAASFGGCSSHYAPYYYLADDAYFGLGVSSRVTRSSIGLWSSWMTIGRWPVMFPIQLAILTLGLWITLIPLLRNSLLPLGCQIVQRFLVGTTFLRVTLR